MVPGRQLADQLRLVEAVPLALGREVGQSVRWQPCLRTLAGLPLDRLHQTAHCGLGCAAMPTVVNGFTVTTSPYGSSISYGSERCARSIMAMSHWCG
jgi:hypothetical protein